MEIEEIKKVLQEELAKDRYDHTLGVMYMAAALAMKYEYDVQKAMKAGILHDCAKGIKNNEAIEYCARVGVSLSQFELSNTSLIHAKLGKYLSREFYQVKDNEILEAIEYHTTGRPKMTLLDKIIYVADYIEPGRKLRDVARLQKMAFQDLDRALYCILEESLCFLKKTNRGIDPLTQKTLEYYKNKIGE